MNRTVILVRSGLIKLEREFVVRAEHLRFEGFVRACDLVLNVVEIHPRHRRSRGYCNVVRHEAEVIDLDLDHLRTRLPRCVGVLHIVGGFKRS